MTYQAMLKRIHFTRTQRTEVNFVFALTAIYAAFVGVAIAYGYLGHIIHAVTSL